MYTITTNRVRDKVAFVEGNERLVLTVDVDPFGVIGDMQGVVSDLRKLNEDTPDEEVMRLAVALSKKMFGDAQTERLVDFYHRNEKQLFNVLVKYFTERLNKLISDAQKRAGKKKLFKR